MLFKRKPPVWQWDDRFSIHLHFDLGPAPNYLFTYIIPSDHYAHLIAGSWNLYTVNLGTSRQVRLICWRGQRQLYAAAFGRSWPADNSVTESFGLVGFPQTPLVAPNHIINQMIPYCYLYPGDRLTCQIINPSLGDMLIALHLTFKFWNV